MTWTEDRLRQELARLRHRRGDTTSIEVKRASGGLPDLGSTICAFANMPDGGTVVLGVDEADGAFVVTGVSDPAALEAGLASTARNAVAPSPHIETQFLSIDGADVVLGHVAPLRIAYRPAVFRGRSYLRQADGDYVMQEHELRMIEVAKLHADERVGYDLQPARGRGMADLVPDLVTAYIGATRAHNTRLRDRTDEQILQATNVLTSAGEPTLAGLYALGDFPQGQFPALGITAAVRLPGAEGRARTRNLHHFSGPLPVLLDELLQWVQNNIDTVNRYRTDGHMEAVAELPLHAVRELVANALVHRDLGPDTLGAGKSIQVRLLPTHLMIQSPGGLRGVSLAQLEGSEHAQAAVNQRLYEISKKLRLPDGASVIEGEGGGIQEVFRSAAERGLPGPQLSDTGVQFTALLWRPAAQTEDEATGHSRRNDHQPSRSDNQELPPLPTSSRPTRNEQTVIRAIHDAHDPSIHDLVSTTSLSIGQIRYALAGPIAEGLVIMDGGQGARTTVYRLAHR